MQLILQLTNDLHVVVDTPLELHRARFGSGEAIDLAIAIGFETRHGSSTLGALAAGGRELALQLADTLSAGGDLFLQLCARLSELGRLGFAGSKICRQTGDRGLEQNQLRVQAIAVAGRFGSSGIELLLELRDLRVACVHVIGQREQLLVENIPPAFEGMQRLEIRRRADFQRSQIAAGIRELGFTNGELRNGQLTVRNNPGFSRSRSLSSALVSIGG